MKTILLLTCFLVLTTTAYSQQNPPSKSLTYEDYLKKSKNQKTTGEIMLVGGLVMVTIAAFTVFSEGIYTKNETPAYLSVIGAGSAVGSIPFFILSGKNKRKAAFFTLGFQPASLPRQNQFSLKPQPAITIKIGL